MSEAPGYTALEAEAALCVWEELLELRHQRPNPPAMIRAAWDTMGSVHMRHEALKLGRWVAAAYALIPQTDLDELCEPFDWEWVPELVKLAVWGPNGVEHLPSHAAGATIAVFNMKNRGNP